jgi:co-chaperonin GroES (HSP10)
MSNKTGINPIFDRVLIDPMEVAKKTDWGFQLSSEETSNREQLANTTGIIISLGEEVPEGIVKVGDKVAFAKYAGLMYTGKDGKEYRMVNYGDLVALLDADMDLVDPHLKKGIK